MRLAAAALGGTALGEIESINSYAPDSNLRCSCGERVPDCALWGSVLSELDRMLLLDPLQEFLGSLRWWRVPNLAKDPLRRRVLAKTKRQREILDKLFRLMASQTPVPLVTSIKAPAVNAILAASDALDVRFLHLVRDSRATAYSWQRRKLLFPDGSDLMRRRSLWNATAEWLYRNIGIELTVRRFLGPGAYELLRYEDFTNDHQRVLDDLVRSWRLAVQGNDEDGPVHHVVQGNPDRFSSGPIVVRPDEEWSQRYPWYKRATVLAITLPLLVRYGYVSPWHSFGSHE